VEKDYYRMLKTNKQIESHERRVRSRKTKASLSLMKYKSRSELLIEEYQDPTVPDDKIYVIDKVVRMRGL
jgi:hypothetical protein